MKKIIANSYYDFENKKRILEINGKKFVANDDETTNANEAEILSENNVTHVKCPELQGPNPKSDTMTVKKYLQY